VAFRGRPIPTIIAAYKYRSLIPHPRVAPQRTSSSPSPTGSMHPEPAALIVAPMPFGLPLDSTDAYSKLRFPGRLFPHCEDRFIQRYRRPWKSDRPTSTTTP